MSRNIEYSSIGKQITMRADLDSFSSRDKVILFQQLMEDLGITQQLLGNENCKIALEIINQGISRNW